VDPDIRAVIISAYGDMKNIRTAMNRGAFDFVTKPIDFEDLEVTIERTLGHIAQWREALSSRDKLVALQNELDVARNMQQSILPTAFPKGDDFEIYGSMEPARSVGGDFFDVIRLDNHRIGIAIADVSGKGVPAALFMMSTRTLLKGAAIGNPEPAEVLKEVNDLLVQDNEAAMFVTVFYAVYDAYTGRFSYANGGHNAPLFIGADGNCSLLPLTQGLALGIVPDLDFQQDSLALKSGDTVVMYTDGVNEAMNREHEEFGNDRLLEIFAGTPPKSATEANDATFAAVNDFVAGAAQSDDITCLILQRMESKS
jgi:sigma-B regulation protein RsbU (phosphoserine phosphatase)